MQEVFQHEDSATASAYLHNGLEVCVLRNERRLLEQRCQNAQRLLVVGLSVGEQCQAKVEEGKCELAANELVVPLAILGLVQRDWTAERLAQIDGLVISDQVTNRFCIHGFYGKKDRAAVTFCHDTILYLPST